MHDPNSGKTVRTQEIFTGERALFGAKEMKIVNSIFENGESPLKESRNIDLIGCMFKWKYPMWYSQDIHVEKSTLFTMARAGIWYTKNVSFKDVSMQAPKGFRRCDNVHLDNVEFWDASETLWSCRNVDAHSVRAHGDYFAMNSENIKFDNLWLNGNYGFDGVKNMEIDNSHLLTKDAFWNTENVIVRNSFISGEYLGWNAKNLTLENCTVESDQGMCYIDNLVMKHCTLINTTLAFEYSTVDAQIDSKIDSVLNPSGGIIRAEHIDSLIIEKDRVDPSKTQIVCKSS